MGDQGRELEVLEYVLADALGGGGCEGYDGDGRKNQGLLEPGELFVGGAEVMAPFTDAMSFVNGNAG